MLKQQSLRISIGTDDHQHICSFNPGSMLGRFERIETRTETFFLRMVYAVLASSLPNTVTNRRPVICIKAVGVRTARSHRTGNRTTKDGLYTGVSI